LDTGLGIFCPSFLLLVVEFVTVLAMKACKNVGYIFEVLQKEEKEKNKTGKDQFQDCFKNWFCIQELIYCL
jgi:hypothetical protein